MKKTVLLISLLVMMTGMTIPIHTHSQVLIALVFGDELNTPGLKFGLDGGINFASMAGYSGSRFTNSFNLGLYFDILLKKETRWYIHTGVILKSPMGGKNLDPYLLNDPDLDTMFAGGKVKRELRYINVPILIRYKFKPNIFIEAGPMAGLLVKATDVFYTKIKEKDDLSYKNNIYKKCSLFDIGVMGGIGYQFMKGTGIDLGIRYYYGFISLPDNASYGTGTNQSIYAFISIPIGAGEKSKEKAAKREQKKLEKKQQKEQQTHP